MPHLSAELVDGRGGLGGQGRGQLVLHHLVVSRGFVLTEPVLNVRPPVPGPLGHGHRPLGQLGPHLPEELPHLPRLVAQVVDDELEDKTFSRGDPDTV